MENIHFMNENQLFKFFLLEIFSPNTLPHSISKRETWANKVSQSISYVTALLNMSHKHIYQILIMTKWLLVSNINNHKQPQRCLIACIYTNDPSLHCYCSSWCHCLGPRGSPPSLHRIIRTPPRVLGRRSSSVILLWCDEIHDESLLIQSIKIMS